MRIPAVAIVAAFAGGILLDRRIPAVTQHSKGEFLLASFLLILLFSFLGLFFARRGRLWRAAIASLLCWAGLGAAAMVVDSQPLPTQHVLSRIASGEIELKTPLR